MANQVLHRTTLEELDLTTLLPPIQEQVRYHLRHMCREFASESKLLEPVTRKGELTLKLKFEFDVESQVCHLTTTVDGKLPGFKHLQQAARIPRGGSRLLTEVDPTVQQDMFTSADDAEEGPVQ